MALDSIVPCDMHDDFSNENYLEMFVEMTRHLHEPQGREKARNFYGSLSDEVQQYIRNSKSGWLVRCVYLSC